jgi:hypothetical protein
MTPKAMKVQYDIFLSYAREDRLWCEQLACRLRQSGVRVWFDRWFVRPGDHLLVRLNEGLQASRRMVAVWSPHYFCDSKVWTLVESFARQHADPLAADRLLIPLLLCDCQVPPTFENIVTIDFRREDDFETSLIELLESLDAPTASPSLHSVEPLRHPDGHSPIENPYLPYSSGALVTDTRMFFGRSDILTMMEVELSKRPAGRCFVMYGQKRSGKSSILRQLELRLAPPCLPVVTSLGLLDVRAPSGVDALVTLLLRALRDSLEERIAIDDGRWAANLESQPNSLEALREGLWAAEEALLRNGWEAPRVVFLIDEFSYLFEYIKECVIPSEFMRYWKALLEMRAFNAVVVGQDSMPSFIAAFPNEFGVTSTARITYLSAADASRLADEPIRVGLETRYRGDALAHLLLLTAGSPYYIQVFCSRLVDYLNDRRRLLITEVDIEAVALELVTGGNSLSAAAFDPLITAAGESVSDFPRETYLQVLTAIAKASAGAEGASMSVLNVCRKPTALLANLRERDIIRTDPAMRIHIRVGLFGLWLRHNC